MYAAREEGVAVSLLTLLLYRKHQLSVKEKRKARKYKTRLINRNRQRDGFYSRTFLKLKSLEPEGFLQYTRMSVPVFNKLLDMIRPHLTRKPLPDGVSPEERLALTIHYLSQGSSMKTIAWKYHLGNTTVQTIIIEVCDAIWQELSGAYLKPPSTQEWKDIADGFYTKWNFPNCVGALDGKHVNIQCPGNSGSQYFNYKKTFSIILMAACDADYNMTMVDIGACGSQSDGGVFKASPLGTSLDDGTLDLPEASKLPGSNIKMPYCFVADEAFPLKPNIMRPYPGRQLTNEHRVFNYRLSRARRTIENCFGILVSRWRILRTTINMKVTNVDKIVKAIVCLHNFLNKENPGKYRPHQFTNSEKPEEVINNPQLSSVGRLASNNSSRSLYILRDSLANYFTSPEGEVPWQQGIIDRGKQPI